MDTPGSIGTEAQPEECLDLVLSLNNSEMASHYALARPQQFTDGHIGPRRPLSPG